MSVCSWLLALRADGILSEVKGAALGLGVSPVPMVDRKASMPDIYRGQRLSKLFGWISGVLLVYSVFPLVNSDWGGAFYAIIGSVLAAYASYRAAGGRHNPELARAAWEKKSHIDVVSDQVASWPAKVEAMFGMLEEESGGDYRTALASLKLANIPESVQAVYAEAVRSPSRDSWNRLKAVFLENPPK